MRFAAFLVFVALAIGLLAQGIPMPPGLDIMNKPLMLLQRAEVEKELKLDGKQKSEIKKVTKEYNDAMNALAKEAQTNPAAGMNLFGKVEPMADEYSKKAIVHLTPEQAKRLTEIGYQCEGNMCLTRPAVQEALALDDAQKSVINDIAKDVRKNRMSIMMTNARDPKKMKSELEKYRVQTDEALVKALSPEQQVKLRELMGAPFKDLKKIIG
jgi:hypothetical protein